MVEKNVRRPAGGAGREAGAKEEAAAAGTGQGQGKGPRAMARARQEASRVHADAKQASKDRFGEKLARRLVALGRSQYDMAGVMGCAQSKVSKWANGKMEPRLSELPRIADYLGLSVRYLVDAAMDEDTGDPHGGGQDQPTDQERALWIMIRRVGPDVAFDRLLEVDKQKAAGRRAGGGHAGQNPGLIPRELLPGERRDAAPPGPGGPKKKKPGA
jgi:transcriptional regulator with XRE-family HTH domain